MKRLTLPTILASSLLAASLLATPAEVRAEDPERVVMRLDQFLDLYEKTREKDEPKRPPRAFAMSSARYEGEVLLDDGDPRFAVFDAKQRIEVLEKEGWVRIPVLPASVALRSAKIGGKEASVVIESGFYTLITDRRGAFDLELKFAAAVNSAQGQSAVTFPLPASGATELQLRVPAEEDLDFQVAGAQLQSDTVKENVRVVEATLPSIGAFSVSWQRELPQETKKLDAQVYAETYTLVGIGDGILRASTTVQHTILFAGKEKLRFAVPDGMTIVEVQGSGIRDWKKLPDGTLEVLLNYAAEGSYGVTVVSEKVIGQKTTGLEAPILKPLDVERSKGWVGVESRGNLEISGGEAKGATPVDVRSLPGAILGITGQPVLLGYKYLVDEVAIPLQVTVHEDVDVLVTLLDQAQARTMWTREGRRLTSVKYQVRNNRKQFLRVNLPEGAELWSASVGGRAVQPARDDKGRVLVPLVRSQASGGSLAAFSVEVVYVESGEKVADNGRGSFNATLPVVDAPTTYVAWTIYSPEKAKIKKRSIEGDFEMVEYLSNPIPEEDEYYIETDTPQMAQTANIQAETGSMGEGAVPVPVSLPLQGEPVYFEKLLAPEEAMSITFDFKGLRR